MKIAVFSARKYTRTYFDRFCGDHELVYFDAHLSKETLPLAYGFPVACVFVNDRVDAEVVRNLADNGLRLLALRSAGYNHVDLQAAAECGVTVVRVPAYSPYAVAEHTVALILGLDRKIPRAHARVREGNFSLQGLLGFDLHGKTVGLIGLGRIGALVAKIMRGFGCRVLAADPYAQPDDGIELVDNPTLFARSDIVTLHCPLTPDTHHIIDESALRQMKDGVMLINTSRGGLVDTPAVIAALKAGKIGHLGLDVYEEEADLFFDDLSDQIIADDVFARLLTLPNVLITAHQAFFTDEAMTAIAGTTMANIDAFATGRSSGNEVTPGAVRGDAGE
ncbi:MAG: 2-hydroxyacid dehydrogenase [Gammaproteobacteria bacterium]|nr:2-hydroxyacid dehydrogenase [Gammaproteobacteria bacterium]NNM20914.1 2-hydroxyacid dehydrogenase [Gammaproteobacteria bacterium]